MFEIGEKFVRVECGQEIEYEIVKIDNEDTEYPYECFSVEILKEADKIAETEGTTRKEILYFGDYDFLDERFCVSEIDILRCKQQAEIKEKELDVEFYKNALESLIDAVSERLEECFEDKLWIFAKSGISPEEFRKLGYDNVACQLEDTEE